ncbi:type II toxin-antitoxin system VapC family toxin [Phenylobacterium montanum]|uniref:Type II toxin-antitoxin system VapC family toxin n=1 Tax=Phenylobacterium montanum TaxID=2823693 RepID=A0A975IUD2_9CAUL|nr:type II toxin-antitoxin system VapC family toxin [Caulobacter sp. S6]QUD87678.1 type II toxin-antitoxin system VapC family toxin [Caulobacter sp. S6]
MSFVLDNSIALAWCFEDEQTPAIMALLDRVAAAGAFAPQLWPIEALNGLLTAERRGRITAEKRRSLAGLLNALPISIDDETAVRTWSATAQLAEAYGLTAYDATYLELTLRLQVPLATSDKRLVAAARAAGVEMLPTS